MGRLSTTECTYLPTYLPTCKKWPDSSLHVSIKHCMCTLLNQMGLVRNVGHSS